MQSLQKKLDSLVKFLEDERSQKKSIQTAIQEKDEVIQELRCQIKQYQGQFQLAHEEMERVRADKQKQATENQQLKVKIFELERQSRIFQAVQNHDQLFLNYNHLSEKLDNTSKCSDHHSRFAREHHSQPRIESQSRIQSRSGLSRELLLTQGKHNQTTICSKTRYRGRSQEPLLSSLKASTCVEVKSSAHENDLLQYSYTGKSRGKSVDFTAMRARTANGAAGNCYGFADVGKGLILTHGQDRRESQHDFRPELSARANEINVTRADMRQMRIEESPRNEQNKLPTSPTTIPRGSPRSAAGKHAPTRNVP